MAYLTLDRAKLEHNHRRLDRIFSSHGVDWGVVTKLLCGDETFLREVLRLGARELLDSRVSNLRRIKELEPTARTVYIKPPARGAIEDVVRWADVSFNTEIATLEALSAEARRQGKVHDVLIMVEMGDLREGVHREELSAVVERALELPGLQVIGLGTNLNCLSGVMPNEDKLVQLGMLREIVALRHGVRLPHISAGTTVTIPLLRSGRVPPEVNHFRVGEALYFGRDLVGGGVLEDMHDDVLTLYAEVIEVSDKAMSPSGELGENPFGERVEVDPSAPVQTGRRALLDVGYLDLHPDYLTPRRDGVEVLDATSDMLVVALDPERADLRVGDTVAFDLRYMGALHLMNSPYVEKRVIGAAGEGAGEPEAVEDDAAAAADPDAVAA